MDGHTCGDCLWFHDDGCDLYEGEYTEDTETCEEFECDGGHT